MPFHYITTQEQLRQLLPTTADVKLELLQSYFDRAEFQLLRPWLGQATLSELHALDLATAPQAWQKLLQLLTPAVASYGYRLYAGSGQQLLTAQGPRRLNTTDQKPLTPAELAAHYKELERDAYAQLDEAQVHLEQHPDVFTSWHGSKFSTILEGQFFTTADDYDRYAQGDMSRIRFRGLWPSINYVTLAHIRPVLGRPLLTRLLTEQHDTAHKDVLNLVRTAVASMVVDDEAASSAACSTLEELVDLLNDSLDQYPEFRSSPEYRPETGPYTNDSPFYIGI